MKESYAYDELNKSWKNACKVILGDEIGELKEYESWLMENIRKMDSKKSSLGGSEISFYSTNYCNDSKRIALQEIDFEKKFKPLNINEAKDLESIINAVQDRIDYTGNVVLGNCKYVEKSTNVADSFFIFNSKEIYDSKQIACCSYAKFCENMFGGDGFGKCQFGIKNCFTHGTKRTMNIWSAWFSADAYYSSNIENCNECFFCFNAKNKKYCIGNLELEKSKYLELKKKLLEEIRETLKSKKRVPSLIDIVKECRETCDDKIAEKIIFETKYAEEKTSKENIEEAFEKASKNIFGKSLENIDSYDSYLWKNVPKVYLAKSALSKREIATCESLPHSIWPGSRIIKHEEAIAFEKYAKLNEKEIEKLKIKNANRIIGKIAYTLSETRIGNNKNLIETVHAHSCQNSYKCELSVESNFTGYCYWPRNSQYVFGTENLHSSISCIKCYNSKNLNRCFECDSCENCTDLYFSHNCENVHDSIFCFNVKNKRNAIGNVEYPKEQYVKIKKMILEELWKRLEKNKEININIFNIGCYGK